SLSIPDHTDLFYPDGQIREEDYEFTSFLSSRMSQSNVRCVNCHNPHTAKTILEGNTLCMSCHNGSFPKAPKMDPEAHSFHKPESTGSQCINCHMPQTVYMQCHWRHDHGFTIPDPLLTKQFNVPNACNRCHKDKDADWSLAACDKWYGARMDRPTRKRARIIARGRLGEPAARDDLLKILAEEPIPLWQASAAGLLGQYLSSPQVVEALVNATGHTDPMVREAAARSLEPLAENQSDTLQRLLSDRSRSVRNAAEWLLRTTFAPDSPPGQELLAYLRLNSDQPAGAMAFGLWHMNRNEPEEARQWFEKAAAWDRYSAAPHDALAVVYSSSGEIQKALAEMGKAVELEPNHAEWRYKLGLAYSEAGNLPKAIESLEQAVKLDPRHAAAMYNLGLAYDAVGDPARALQSLLKAEALEPTSPRIPYATATILAKLRQKPQARAAALRALQIDPRYAPARELLKALGE
ncbi:MAG: tetratricopeptide repeat protein, partial [Tepidisphaeraceae bacterium]